MGKILKSILASAILVVMYSGIALATSVHCAKIDEAHDDSLSACLNVYASCMQNISDDGLTDEQVNKKGMDATTSERGKWCFAIAQKCRKTAWAKYNKLFRREVTRVTCDRRRR